MRNSTIFFGFIGPAIEQGEKVFPIKDGYELWNLKKFSLDDFNEELKRKIPPINNNVLRNYKAEDNSREMHGLTQKQFEQCSWGLVIPDTLEDGGFGYAEVMFLLNLYSPNFLYPQFYANDMGIWRQAHNKDSVIYFHDQNHSHFKTTEFVSFYKDLFECSKYGSWHLDRIQAWNKEDWRLFVAALLYSGLKDYENEKSSFGWQRESAEMATILEALFTADDSQNEEVVYRLRKRVTILLLSQFPTIERDIKELYKTRSSFVHGSFFAQIAKDSPEAYNNIPTPDFNLLYRHKEYVRFAFVAYLNLSRLIKSGLFKEAKSVMDILEQAVIDIKLREKITKETDKIFSLMPSGKISPNME